MFAYKERHIDRGVIRWDLFNRNNAQREAEMNAYRGKPEDIFYGYLYRFDNHGDELRLSAYLIKHPTPKGHTIYTQWGGTTFVSQNWRRKFACPTIQEAFTSFVARKTKQKAIYQRRIDNINAAIAAF